MPEESIWGKNAVDATRKNALPQYIDDTIGEVKGQYVKKSGDTMTGALGVKATNIDLTKSAPSSNQYGAGLVLRDTNGTSIGTISPQRTTADLVGTYLQTVRTINGSNVYNKLTLSIAADGTRSVQVSNAAAWQTALSVLPLSGGTLTGGLTISAGGISITGNASVNGHTYIQGAHHIYFNSGHGHGIIWRENDTTYAGEALYIGGYFNGVDDSNYLHIQGSTTGGTSTSWHNIMTLTAKTGNLSITGSIWAGTLTTALEIDVGARANAGSIYLYSASATNGNRGIYGKNHDNTGHYYIYCGQDNLIHSSAYSVAAKGSCIRDIDVRDSADSSVSTKYIIMKRG